MSIGFLRLCSVRHPKRSLSVSLDADESPGTTTPRWWTSVGDEENRIGTVVVAGTCRWREPSSTSCGAEIRDCRRPLGGERDDRRRRGNSFSVTLALAVADPGPRGRWSAHERAESYIPVPRGVAGRTDRGERLPRFRELPRSGPRLHRQHDRQRGSLGFAVAGAAGFSVTASLCALGAFLVGAVHRWPRRPPGAGTPQPHDGRDVDGGESHDRRGAHRRRRSRRRGSDRAGRASRSSRCSPSAWAPATLPSAVSAWPT